MGPVQWMDGWMDGCMDRWMDVSWWVLAKTAVVVRVV